MKTTDNTLKLEEVLVVPASTLFSNGYFNGIERQNLEQYFQSISQSYLFIPRNQAEEDESYKQLIPYLVVMHNGKVLLLERFKTQGEARLHNKLSIGIGGHVNRVDEMTGKTPWECGLKRELHEELTCNGEYHIKFIGLLNDDTVSVGKVHLGLVYLVEFNSGDVTVKEQDKMSGRFVSLNDLKELYPHMETWSQIVYDQYLKTISSQTKPGSFHCCNE